ncbi:tetratricopeptide repeat-containing sensor histidine kinase [Taibaiella soli]|uniref:histidine kinase n=1 Tax=Taibaiella soli TaxID=1649169 RepID=A0A2W2B7X6_9BACT|nr:histidine kinase [Taibaiella soli]PZF72067.1 hypothetical protein DN068_14100 [Taibaiella soli]
MFSRNLHIPWLARYSIILLPLLFLTDIFLYGQTSSNKEQFSISYGIPDSLRIDHEIDSAKKILEYAPDSGIQIFKSILSESRTTGYAKGIYNSFISLGKGYAMIGKYGDGIGYWKDGITFIYATGKGTDKLSSFYGNIGAIYGIKGDYETALQYVYKAIDLSKNDEQLIMAYNNAANILLRMPNMPATKPLHYLELAAQKARKAGNKLILASILTNMGSVYVQQEDWTKSKSYFDSALALAEGPEMAELKYSTLLSLGELSLSQHQPNEALPYFYEAQSLTGQHVNPYYTVTCDLRLGEAYIQLKDYNTAQQFAKRAEEKTRELGIVNNRVQAFETLSRLYKQMGAHEKALVFYQEYTHLKDSLFRQTTIDRVNEMDIRYNTAQKEKEIADNQLLIANQQNRLRLNNVLLIAGSGGILLLVIILIVVSKNAKQKQKILISDHTISNLKAMMKGEEKERIRIARELHDGIGGMLAAVKINFSSLTQTNPSLRSEKAKHIEEMLQSTAQEVRTVAHNLMPDIVLQFGLQKSLETYCNNISGRNPHPEIHLQFYGDLSLLDKSTELILYRICQELIQNVLKHAQATRIEIQIMEYEGKINLTIEDNGVGFDTNEVNYGMGLQNLQFRMQALQGFISVASRKGEGTSVHIEFDVLQSSTTNTQ